MQYLIVMVKFVTLKMLIEGKVHSLVPLFPLITANKTTAANASYLGVGCMIPCPPFSSILGLNINNNAIYILEACVHVHLWSTFVEHGDYKK